jgi:hypothetical protein
MTTMRSARTEKQGNRLYQHAKVIQENKNRLKAKLDKEREDKEMGEATFRPVVYTRPKHWQVRDPEARPEDYLLLKEMEKKQNLERLK